MKITEVIKHSYHKIKSDATQFRKNMGVREPMSFYNPTKLPQPKNKLIKVLGHGVYAAAVMSEKNPNSVMKISRGTNNLEDDPYYGYLSSIATHPNVESNPFIPRVYQVKVYETTDNIYKFFYIVKMERLYELTSLSDQELIKFILTITKSKMTVGFKAALGISSGDQILKKQSHEQLIHILVDKIRREKIKDPQLQAAMNIAASTGFEFDITPSNIMVRKTPSGPQLVLADPVRN